LRPCAYLRTSLLRGPHTSFLFSFYNSAKFQSRKCLFHTLISIESANPPWAIKERKPESDSGRVSRCRCCGEFPVNASGGAELRAASIAFVRSGKRQFVPGCRSCSRGFSCVPFNRRRCRLPEPSTAKLAVPQPQLQRLAQSMCRRVCSPRAVFLRSVD
jgi:hypothetical protein